MKVEDIKGLTPTWIQEKIPERYKKIDKKGRKTNEYGLYRGRLFICKNQGDNPG